MLEGGYAGWILSIDLSNKKIMKQPLEKWYARNFIGGFGINSRIAYENIRRGIQPLSPDNVIILGAGPLVGTMAPGAARLAMTTKYPENGTIFASSGSMNFACQLKFAGFDHIVISGKSDKKVYIYIDNEHVEIKDAAEYWRMDIFEVTEKLWAKHSRNASVIAIGQAGENQAKISVGIIDKTASLGNKGGASVFGSKNIKAVVVKGDGGIHIYDQKGFMGFINKMIKRIKSDSTHEKMVELGSMAKFSGKSDWSFENRNHIFPAEAANKIIGTQVYLEKVKKGRVSCPSCPFAEHEVLEIREGEFNGLRTTLSSWYGGCENFGVQCQVGSYNRVVKSLDKAQRYGICRFSVSAAIDYAVHLFEEGKLKKSDTNGLELKRDFETTDKILDLIAENKGFGEIIGGGIKALAERFGGNSNLDNFEMRGTAVTTSADPRITGFDTIHFEHIVNPKGHHSACWAPSYDPKDPDKFIKECQSLGIPEEAISRIMHSKVGFNLGRLTRYSEDWHAVSSSLGFCLRGPYRGLYSIDDYCEVYAACTGIEIGREEMMKAGERSWNLFRVMNAREGFRRENDSYPQKWVGPLEKADGTKLSTINKYDKKILEERQLNQMIEDYYDERGWDKLTGNPTVEKLNSLGLKNVSREISKINENR